MRISDWSSDVCSSDLTVAQTEEQPLALFHLGKQPGGQHHAVAIGGAAVLERDAMHHRIAVEPVIAPALRPIDGVVAIADIDAVDVGRDRPRSEERRVGKECVSTCRSRWSPYP